MEYEKPTNHNVWGDDKYHEYDSVTKKAGSTPPAIAFEMLLREMHNFIEACGLKPSKSDNTQLYQALMKKLSFLSEISQKYTYLIDNNIILSEEKSIYIKNISSSEEISFSIDASKIDSDKIITFELLLDLSMTEEVPVINFIDTVEWLNLEIPELSETKKYLLVFRKFPDFSFWLGNLQGEF
ncbi:MAG: hypothetical protein ACK5N8_02325 [Alphaproteobacteria bacterium]